MTKDRITMYDSDRSIARELQCAGHEIFTLHKGKKSAEAIF